MSKIYKNNIERETVTNSAYRKVIFTTPNLQLVLMSIPVGEEIGMESHPHTTQFIRIEEGLGVAYVSGHRYNLKAGDAIIVPPRTRHNVKATTILKLYTIYSPPVHSLGTIERVKLHVE